MNLLFVHGWSVTNTDTYGELPEVLKLSAPELNLNVLHVYLGRYISFHDEVKVEDIARAFERARVDILGDETEFSCITHSTGGPVIRTWVSLFYGNESLSKIPLKHLVMLAPANHGSALAQLGKSKIGRIKAWFQGVEPGQGVLDWLELGSTEQRKLNLNWLSYSTVENKFFPFVLTGEMIDKRLYDYINSYTAEAGSDGVVRVASANMNYQYVKLTQKINDQVLTIKDNGSNLNVYPLEIETGIQQPSIPIAFEVIPRASHSGNHYGIMKSIRKRNYNRKSVVKSIIECLKVKNKEQYITLTHKMNKRTEIVQSKSNKYTMIVVRVKDNCGYEIQDYDLYLLAGKEYQPNRLRKNFFLDRQKNSKNLCQLTYYLSTPKMHNVPDGKIGIRIVARPIKGFVRYAPGEFRSKELDIIKLLKPNEVLLLDIELRRNVDKNTFVIGDENSKPYNFKDEIPSGQVIKV